MRVLLHVPVAAIEQRIVETLAEADIEVVPVAEVPALCSALYRDPDAFGLMGFGDGSPAAVCAEFRAADVTNLLMVLLGGGLATRQAMCAALLAGADDVQTLPIDGRELVARIVAMHRRGEYRDHRLIKMPGCVFDGSTGRAYSDRRESVRLSPKEGAILSTLAMRAGDVVTTAKILNSVYGDGSDEEPDEKIISVLVHKLRKKLFAMNGGRDVIRTVWGRGFTFEPAGFVPEYMANGRMRSPR